MTSLSIARNAAITSKRQQDSASHQEEFSARPFIVSGQFSVTGAGELVKDINFPVTFTDKPLLSFGANMDENQIIVAGNFPTASVIVLKYKEKITPGTSTASYTGASLIVVTTGMEDQIMWIHWQMSGTALVNPVSNRGATSGRVT